jgi:hypothetical protein
VVIGYWTDNLLTNSGKGGGHSDGSADACCDLDTAYIFSEVFIKMWK